MQRHIRLITRPGFIRPLHVSSIRLYASKNRTDPSNAITDGPARLPHVTEEAAAMEQIMNPDDAPTSDQMEEGMPIEDAIASDPEVRKNAPQVLKKTDPLSTENQDKMAIQQDEAPVSLHIPEREDPLLTQVVNLLMKDGKKARAQTYVQKALEYVKLQTGVSNPVSSLRSAVDAVAPLFRIVSTRKGSKVIVKPIPLYERQRHRRAFLWILEASDKRKSEKGLSTRLGEEILAVLNGSSAAFEKKQSNHKTALMNRANTQLY